MYHPDNELFQIFGENYTTVTEDQERLFYVAATRAKERLYIISDKKRESVFLKRYNA